MTWSELDWEEHKRLVSLHKARLNKTMTSFMEMVNNPYQGYLYVDHRAMWGAAMPEMKEFFR